MSAVPSDVSEAGQAGVPPRFQGIVRPYSQREVEKLRGSVKIEHSLARRGAERLWQLLHTRPYVHALGAISGNQAVQMVRAGLESIYISGWQVAADGNSAGQTYPDQSLYPVDSVPNIVRRINRALVRADQIEHAEGKVSRDWLAPMVADAEAGFGGPLNAFELMKAMIEAGAGGVHFEDQLASREEVRPHGRQGAGADRPVRAHADRRSPGGRRARRADPADRPHRRRQRQAAAVRRRPPRPRVHRVARAHPGGLLQAQGRGRVRHRPGALAYAPYADLIWCETSTPDLHEAKQFAEGVHKEFPGKLLAYNCSPSFNWRKNLDEATIARFQRELGAMGYKYQFVTLAGFHALNYSMFELALGYHQRDMAAYTELQQAEFAAERYGYTATRHQHEVGTGYFDKVTEVISGGHASTLALVESTEAQQF